MLAVQAALSTLQQASTDNVLEQRLRIAKATSVLNAAATMGERATRNLSEAQEVADQFMREDRMPWDKPWGENDPSLEEFLNRTVYNLHGHLRALRKVAAEKAPGEVSLEQQT